VLVENKIDMKIKNIYISKKIDAFLSELQQINVPYSPQPYGIVEKTNRTIMECAKSMILV
jgi:hypothetical protein